MGSALCAIRFRSNPSGNVHITNNSYDCPNVAEKISYDTAVTACGAGKISGDYTLAGAIQRYGTTVPVAGTYSQMSVIWSENVGVGKPLGHVCVSGGEPGVWAPFGYIGEIKRGTSTISGLTDSVVVEHGLGVLPAYVSPTPLGNTGHVWVSDMTATHFTVRCSAAPAVDTPLLWGSKSIRSLLDSF